MQVLLRRSTWKYYCKWVGWACFRSRFSTIRWPGWLVKAFAYRGYEARLVGCAIIPSYFGYYMQTRGYFFQIFVDGLFMLASAFAIEFEHEATSPCAPPACWTTPQAAQSSGPAAAALHNLQMAVLFPEKMRILVDCVPLVSGGGIQVAIAILARLAPAVGGELERGAALCAAGSPSRRIRCGRAY